MDPYAIPFVATALDAVHWLVTSLAHLLVPFAGSGSAALAVVALTVIVRALLIPVGISTVRAELTRRRLAPELNRLRRRYARNPELLQRKTMEVYGREKVSPFAGLLPLLAQAPVLSLVYGLFVVTSVNGHPNELLAQQLFDVGLGQSLVGLFGAGSWWPAIAVFGAVLALLATVAALSRAVALRFATEPPAPKWMTWLPFLTVGFAMIVPLAAALYLTVSTAWTLAERTLLRRVLA